MVFPHAAPALFTRTWSAFSRAESSWTSRSTSESFCRSAGMATHEPGPKAFSSFAVSSQSFAERELM